MRPFKSFNELIDSDVKIIRSLFHDNFFSRNTNYWKKIERGEFEMQRSQHDNEAFVKRFKLASLQYCKKSDFIIKYLGDGKSYEGFYLIPEVVLSGPEYLFCGFFNPYIEKFKKIMDLSFEVGLPKAWDTLHNLAIMETLKRNLVEPEKIIVDLSAIAPVFCILASGLLLAFFALLCEIFHKDFVNELSYAYYKKKFLKIFRRNLKHS